jgi:hypothetical protein
VANRPREEAEVGDGAGNVDGPRQAHGLAGVPGLELGEFVAPRFDLVGDRLQRLGALLDGRPAPRALHGVARGAHRRGHFADP